MQFFRMYTSETDAVALAATRLACTGRVAALNGWLQGRVEEIRVREAIIVYVLLSMERVGLFFPG